MFPGVGFSKQESWPSDPWSAYLVHPASHTKSISHAYFVMLPALVETDTMNPPLLLPNPQ